MGQHGEGDHEDSNKKETQADEVTQPPSYDSLVLQSVTSVNEKNLPEKEVSTAWIETVKDEKNLDKTDEKDKDDKEEKEESSDSPPVGLIELVIIQIFISTHPMIFQFKFSTPLDAFLIIFGVTLAFGCGSAMPILCILFGDTLQAFVDDTTVKAINQTLQENGLSLNSSDTVNLPEPMMTVIGR